MTPVSAGTGSASSPLPICSDAAPDHAVRCGAIPQAATRAGASPGGNRSLSPVSQSGEISISRVFDAPRELVYRAFVDPDQLCQWFGPAGFSVPCETVQSDARAGGFL